MLHQIYPESTSARIRNWGSQIWPIAKEMMVGDWVVLPSKKKPAIHIGEIKGSYVNKPGGETPYYHYRDVNWFATDIPRSNFEQDILYSFGALMTICRISRNDAENRIKKMEKNNWQVSQFNANKINKNIHYCPVKIERATVQEGQYL